MIEMADTYRTPTEPRWEAWGVAQRSFTVAIDGWRYHVTRGDFVRIDHPLLRHPSTAAVFTMGARKGIGKRKDWQWRAFKTQRNKPRLVATTPATTTRKPRTARYGVQPWHLGGRTRRPTATLPRRRGWALPTRWELP